MDEASRFWPNTQPTLCNIVLIHIIARTHCFFADREFFNKSAASAASLDYVKFQAVIKSAASAASLTEAALAADWITTFFRNFWPR